MPFTHPPNPVYGFVGIGVMGYGMAANLCKKSPASSPFILCEIDVGRREKFVTEFDRPVTVVDNPKAVAEQADIIVTMLPRALNVHECFTNPSSGFLAASNVRDRQKLFLECSSIDTQTSATLAILVSSFSPEWYFVDAPVSGGPAGANAGTLTFMVGLPSSELFEQVLPSLEMMGTRENIFHCGGPGAGLATKQLNNYLGYIGYVGLCEVMNTGLLYGLDPKTLSSVINASSGMNWNSLHQNPVKGVNPKASSANDFKGGFTTELAGGVIDDAVALMKQVGAKSVLADATKEVFVRARMDPRCKGQEARSVWRLFQNEAP